MVTGFIKLNGTTVGAIANRTEIYDEKGEKCAEFKPLLTAKGLEKAENFVRFCDAFDIPILTVTNAEGFFADMHNEFRIAKQAARFAYALSDATVPKVNLITGKAFGSGYTIMNSQALGADITFAWEDALIGMMDAKLAAGIMYDGSDAKTLNEKASAYEKLQQGVDAAAARGYVDTVIKAEDTRKMVIGAFEMLYTKAEERPDKKHGTV
jgi:acetyl-CoA carboxylase carboxyltransferase component